MAPPPVSSASGLLVGCALVAFLTCSIALSWVDARRRRLPNRAVLWGSALTLGSCVLAVLVGWAQGAPSPGGASSGGLWLLETLGGAGAMFGALLLVRMLSPSGVGGGDVKVAPMIGGVLGLLAGWSSVAIGFALAFALAGAWGLALRLRGGGRRAELPFAPCLFGGAWGALALVFTVG